MKWPWQKIEEKAQFESTLQRLVAAIKGEAGKVSPDTCMNSPTVHAVVTAIARRISVTPVHVYQTGQKNGRDTKEKLPNHPVARLLRKPNPWQSSVDYWQDLVSTLVRHGKYIAIKGQGVTGPIRTLYPVSPSSVAIKQDQDTLAVTFKPSGQDELPMGKVHYIRGPAIDFINAESPINNIRTAIAIEIACENYGAEFFANGAMPLLIFKYAQGAKGFKNPEDEARFISDFQRAFSGANRHKAMLLPPGMDQQTPSVENDKAQFLETRKFMQTVIAGALGVAPHFAGNLENAHYNNIEQSDKDFTLNVIMPYVRAIESAMERDLLTDQDRNSGIVIRFNLDSVLRASFEERQAGLKVQFESGVINQNEWREVEGKNPRPDGDDYYYSANLIKEGEEPTTRVNAGDPPAEDPAENDGQE